MRQFEAAILLVILILPTISIANNLPIINQKKILATAPRLSATALQYAIKGYHWALLHGDIKNPDILTVINFNLPSAAKRVWVIDLVHNKVLMRARTTQGKGSGLYYARRFSNRPDTDETSLGTYVTLNHYYGKHGLSLRLKGLEKGINNNALRRAVVIHPAWYVSPTFVHKYQRCGRSWGCFALNPAISKRMINLIENGSVIFAYATPEKHDPYLR